MNTQTFEYFEILDNDRLSAVEGGGMIRCADVHLAQLVLQV